MFDDPLCGISENNCAPSTRMFTAPTGRCGRSSIRVSCLMRCSQVRTGRVWAASGSMCKVTPCATPTGSNEPLYGRTDTKSPMVYSSMVHVAGGEEGSIRHDDDGRTGRMNVVRVTAAAPRHTADPRQQQPATEPGWATVPGGVLRRRLDEDAALLAVYLDVPSATSRIGAASYR
jgi:hypothetical protein